MIHRLPADEPMNQRDIFVARSVYTGIAVAREAARAGSLGAAAFFSSLLLSSSVRACAQLLGLGAKRSRALWICFALGLQLEDVGFLPQSVR